MTVSSTPNTNCMTGSDEGLSSRMIGLRSRARLMSLKAVACAINATSVQPSSSSWGHRGDGLWVLECVQLRRAAVGVQ